MSTATPPERNSAFVRALELNRPAIEAAFGSPLEWDVAEGRKHAKVLATIEAGGYRDEQAWGGIHDNLLSAMTRLRASCEPYLKAAHEAAQSKEPAIDKAQASPL